MVASSALLRPAVPNRRRRVRHKIQTPAYASFTAQSQGAMLDLHEILNISEDGLALQCHSPLEVNSQVNLCLDLADCANQIFTTGEVIWANDFGRAGIRFFDLPSSSLARLREWLFLNVIAGVANDEVGPREFTSPRPDYTDTLSAVTAVQRQVEGLGADLSGALQLIAERAHSLVRGTGVAIALADDDPEFMICRASFGDSAPPVGARLQIGSGFSGECVKSGRLIRCEDSENDVRLAAETCRALGIRSLVAAPVLVGKKSIGIIEAFSDQPDAFSAAEEKVLQRLGETIVAAVNRAARAENLPPLVAPKPEPISAAPGSVLFAGQTPAESETANDKNIGGVSLPRSHLVILLIAAAMIALVLGYSLAPWIQSKFQERGRTNLQTVLASTQPPKTEEASGPTVETATLEQLRQMADNGDAAAENALGLRYATGDGIKLDEKEAVRWFTRAAENGSVAAQSKLGSFYYSGRGVPADATKAYFWMAVARLSGDDASKALTPFVRARLTRAQAVAIDADADRWLQEHYPTAKPSAGR